MNWMRIENGRVDSLPLSIYDTKHAPITDAQAAAPGPYLAQLFGTLRRRRWRIFAIAVCGTGLATLVGLLASPKPPSKVADRRRPPHRTRWRLIRK
jgi:hypothetical protein